VRGAVVARRVDHDHARLRLRDGRGEHGVLLAGVPLLVEALPTLTVAGSCPVTVMLTVATFESIVP